MSALTDLFGNIADAIRYKRGTSSSIVASNFPSEIMNIPSANDGYKFKGNLAPDYWGTQITLGTEYSSTNKYGLWTIKASGYDGRTIRQGFGPAYTLEGSMTSSAWVSNDLQTSGETSATVEVDFPIKILPQTVTLRPTDRFSSYNIVAHIYFSPTTSGNDWVELTQVTDAKSTEFKEAAITTTDFYRRMKIITDKGSDYKIGYYTIEITEGYWKEA